MLSVKIPEVPKFANGTGLFNGYRNPITKTTLALLNDGKDSPRNWQPKKP